MAGAIHHVTTKAHPGRLLFVETPDYDAYLDLVSAQTRARGWHVLNHCGMRNHAHFLIETPEADLGAGMKTVQERFARYANSRDEAGGRVFAERFFSKIVADQAYFSAAMRYISRNPVAAKLCRRPSEWASSAYHELAGVSRSAAGVVAVERALDLLGGSTAVGRTTYLELVHEPDDELLVRLRARARDDSWLVAAIEQHQIPIARIGDHLSISRSQVHRRLVAARRVADATDGTVPGVASRPAGVA